MVCHLARGSTPLPEKSFPFSSSAAVRSSTTFGPSKSYAAKRSHGEGFSGLFAVRQPASLTSSIVH
ncbi:hypothetical protein HYPDE_29053 [Hyphomicrobium denitrificans 1NES1]|uniref:Uncharacterized protein n=1 Tax=Hyphomicrobium denitrificans 1NES1 TaxID=670307 RepID=N0B1Z8_9HYPH|nr:hypothetical protein HYPDE_29053 [Hyphomicrobium denitrificans 1NES1]